MNNKMITRIVAVLAFVLGTVNLQAQTNAVTLQGEDTLSKSSFYFYNVGAKGFLYPGTDNKGAIAANANDASLFYIDKMSQIHENYDTYGANVSADGLYLYNGVWTKSSANRKWAFDSSHSDNKAYVLSKVTTKKDRGSVVGITHTYMYCDAKNNVLYKSSTGNYDPYTENTAGFYLISESQYNTIYPQKYLRSVWGDAVSTDGWTSGGTISTVKKDNQWTVSSTDNLSMTISGLTKGKTYDFHVYCYVKGTSGDATISVTDALNGTKTVSAVDADYTASTLCYYSFPVKVNSESITININNNTDGNTVYAALKGINEADDYIRNSNFEFGPSWSEYWEGNIGSDKSRDFICQTINDFLGHGKYAEMYANSDNNTSATSGDIHQTIHLTSGTYLLSGMFAARNRNAILYADVPNYNEQSVSFTSEVSPHAFTFYVPAESDVVIGLRHECVADGNCWMALDNLSLKKVGDDTYALQSNDKDIKGNLVLPTEAAAWASDWDGIGSNYYTEFTPAVGNVDNGFDGSALFAEMKGTNETVGDGNIYKTIKGLSYGSYSLSADVFATGREGTLYAKAGDEELASISYTGSKTTKQIDFSYFSDDDLVIGFRHSKVDGSNECAIGVDNFRLTFNGTSYSDTGVDDDYIKNAHFAASSDGWDYEWSGIGDDGFKKSINGVYPAGECGSGIYPEMWSANYASMAEGNLCQTVLNLPAGAYTLSADVVAQNRVGYLYAKIGDKEQKVRFMCDNATRKSLDFVVPVVADVTIGFRHVNDGVCNNVDNPVWMACDNFRLVRTGEAEGADLTSQIVNSDFTANRGDALNEKYGWEADGSGFYGFGLEYDNVPLCEIFYDVNNSYTSDWETYDTYQTVTGLPDGWYKVDVQGFYRDAAAGKHSFDTKVQKTYIYANNVSANIMHIDAVQRTDTIYKQEGTVPFTMKEAYHAFNDYGDYKDNSVIARVTDGTLKIGVKRNEATDHDWVILNYFHLTYLYEDDALADVSGYIANPSFEEGNTNGWTLEGTATVDKMDDAQKSIYDGNFILNASASAAVSQKIIGLPAGTYKLTAQVSTSGTPTFSLNDSTTSLVSNGVISYTVTVADGDTLTIKLTSTADFIADNFTIAKTGTTAYLYNADDGAFYGKLFSKGTSDYDASLKNSFTVGFSNENTPLTVNYDADKQLYEIIYEGTHIGVEKPNNSNSVVTRRNSSSKNYLFEIFKEDASSKYYRISVNPADATYGENASYTNAGSTASSNEKIGKTYMGWSGESSYQMALPLIPAADNEPRGLNWMMMTQKQYDKYHEAIAAAHAARMAAWPILRSARRSTADVDVSDLEAAYYNLSSTAEQISVAAEAAKASILELVKSFDGSDDKLFIDLSFLVADADCQNLDATTAWNTNLDVTDLSRRSNNDQYIGGRYYVKDGSVAGSYISNSISNIPSGKYTLKVDMSAVINKGVSSSSTAISGISFVTGNKSTAISITDGACKFTVNELESEPFYVLSDSIATVGVKVDSETNATFIMLDNFQLHYYGPLPVGDHDYNETDGVLAFTGVWATDEQKEQMKTILETNKNATVVDFQDESFDLQFDVNIGDNTIGTTSFTNPNVIIYVNKNTSHIAVDDAASNVVVNDGGTQTCKKLALTDAQKYVLNIPKSFTAENATYSRTSTIPSCGYLWGTIVLPFDVTARPEGVVDFYGLTQLDSDNARINVDVLNEDGALTANTPALYKANGNVSISETNALVHATSELELPTSDKTEACFFGTYTPYVVGVKDPAWSSNSGTEPATVNTPNEDGLCAEDCYYIKDNRFKNGCAWFNIGCFRAFIYGGKDAVSGASLRLSMFDIVEGANFNDVDAITECSTDPAEVTVTGIYDVNGSELPSLQSGVNIVKYSNGTIKKVYMK